MDQSLLNLSLILVGLKSGQTYASASHGLNLSFEDQKDARLLKTVNDAITKGTLQATDGVSFLLEYFRLAQNLKRQQKQKLASFKMQVNTGIALSVALVFVSFTPLVPDLMRPKFATVLCSAALIAIGLGCCKMLESRLVDHQRCFDFLFCLKRIAINLRSGRTFQTSLSELSQEPLRSPKNKALRERLALVWSQIICARERGFELSPLIEQIFVIELASAQDAFDSKVQQVATQFLLPLYVCFLPAAMLPIFAPLMGALSHHFF
jgi:hypothetical protein